MPKIIRLHAFGGPEGLKIEELPSQPPDPGEVLLKVEAAALNRDHYTFLNGQQFKGHGFVQPQLPSRLGYEAAGQVDAVGEGVDKSWVGKRVATIVGFDESRYGVVGQEAVVPASHIHTYPSNLSAEQIAGVWVPYLTAYGALVHIAEVKQGDLVSIPAATSTVGLAAMQIAHDAGAQAIAITRSAAKRDELFASGADYVIVTAEEDYECRIKEISKGKGVRISFDPIGGPFLEQVANAAAPGGFIIEYGMLSGLPAPFPLYPVIGKGLTLRGYTVSEVTRSREIVATAIDYITERLADGRFIPTIAKVFYMDEIVEAYRYLKANEGLGKIVVKMA